MGLGRIGSAVAKKLQAFGCQVSAFDPYVRNDVFKSLNVKPLNLEEALETAEVLSLHCPLTSKTKGLINSKTLELMKSDAILINCARGALIKEHDLIEALKSRKIAGACLDVFETEPLLASSELKKLPNLNLSPHVGGFTEEAQNKSALEAAQQVKNWFEQGQPVLKVLPPAYEWARDL